MADLYNRDVLRLAASLVAGDRLEMAQGTAEASSRTCGSRISADVNLDSAGRVDAVALRTHACAIGQASAAILRSNAAGKTPDAIAKIRDGIASYLTGKSEMPYEWPELLLLAVAREYPARHAAILLPYDALLTAIEKAG
jgi:NifU-like protein involved in Fe-S cluster formation